MYDVTVFIFLGIIETAIGLLFFLKKVAPNKILGYKRLLKKNNDKLWYSFHRLFGRNLMISGIILIFLSVLIMLIFKHAENETLRIINTVVMIVLLAITIIRCEIYLNKKL